MLSVFGALPEYCEAFETALHSWPGASPILAISAETLADPAHSTPGQRELLDAAIATLHLENDADSGLHSDSDPRGHGAPHTAPTRGLGPSAFHGA